MKLVSGSLNDDWYPLTPGDMVVPTCDMRLSWPPDGCGLALISGSLKVLEPYKSRRVEPGHPLFLVSHIRRNHRGLFWWYRGTWSIVHDGERLWWVGTGSSGSL